jgi:hypothetical protein
MGGYPPSEHCHFVAEARLDERICSQDSLNDAGLRIR